MLDPSLGCRAGRATLLRAGQTLLSLSWPRLTPEKERRHHLREHLIKPSRPPGRVYLIYARRHGHRVIHQALHTPMITRWPPYVMPPCRPSSQTAAALLSTPTRSFPARGWAGARTWS